MVLFTKDSLETLRGRIDLIDVITPHVELKRSGATYKGLCPFHDEKSPSFTVNRGDSHYHCFGCGAHGDAIQFLIEHQRLGFQEAVENLAQKFGVPLQIVEDHGEASGPRKSDIKAGLDLAAQLYHFLLLQTEEGHQALEYLYRRGLTLDFIRQFQLGLAPKASGLLRKVLHEKAVTDELLIAGGLLALREDGSKREFFNDRILFPIRDSSGAVVGFSARKYREETYGGKYINTAETVLFKKSRVLFGLNYCRKRIAKEQQAIIVEGQIDALSLIFSGLNLAVAGLGTAFGEGHIAELVGLGVKRVFLALDSDRAGQEATRKIGNLFQKQGVEVSVVQMPLGHDPDSLLRAKGIDHLIALLKSSSDYISFLVRFYSKDRDIASPAVKTQIVHEVAGQIRGWDHPLMVHESLRKLAELVRVPEQMVGVGQEVSPHYSIRRSASAGLMDIDPDRILESDLLRWLVVSGEKSIEYSLLAANHVKPEDLRVEICSKLLRVLYSAAQQQRTIDILGAMTEVGDPECQPLFAELMQKKIDKERGREHLLETIQRILDRNWMERCEVLRMKIQGGSCNDDEVSALVKEFDQLKRQAPKVKNETASAFL